MGIGFRELLIILVIALILFGAKKLRHVGSDLGAAVRGFKKAVNDGELNFVDGVREYGEKAHVMKRLFTDNGFRIVYDTDLDAPIAMSGRSLVVNNR